MKVVILAAGRGSRLGALTEDTPKPLLPVHGTPLVVHHLRRLKAAGFSEIWLNISYHAEKIRSALGNGEAFGLSLHYSYEPVLLETAGGIIQILPHLGSDPFMVLNADIWTDYPFERLRTIVQPAHLVLVDNPPAHPQGDFALIHGQVSKDGEPRYTYSGIAVFDPKVFAPYAPGRRRLISVFDAQMDQAALFGEYYRGIWQDVGTPAVYQALTSEK